MYLWLYISQLNTFKTIISFAQALHTFCHNNLDFFTFPPSIFSIYPAIIAQCLISIFYITNIALNILSLIIFTFSSYKKQTISDMYCTYFIRI
jgi:hypothetical protein